MLWLIALAACGLSRNGGGTAVGNPSLAVARLAAPAGGEWGIATADRVTFHFEGCNGTQREVTVDGDLLEGESVRIPHGTWCGLEVTVEGLRAAGDATLEIPEATASIALDAVEVERRTAWIVELGEPGAPDALRDRSGLFRELVVDGALDPLERADGPAGAGVARTPEDPDPPVLLAVGVDGLRAALTTPEAPDYAQFDDRGIFVSAAHDAGRWVVVGGDEPPLSATSVDRGVTWTIATPGVPLSGVVAHEGRFVAASFSSRLLTSDDGLSWTVRDDASAVWRALVGSPDGVVVVGDAQVAYSPDGVAWSVVSPPGAPTFHDVAWGAGRFVAVGEGGERWFSDDGTTWTFADEGGDKLYAVAFSGSAFVAAGDTSNFRSFDGVTWEPLPHKSLESMVFHDGALWGPFDDAVFRSTDDGETWTLWKSIPDALLIGLGTNRPAVP